LGDNDVDPPSTEPGEVDMLDERTAGVANWPNPLGLLLVENEPAVLALYRREDDGTGDVVAWVVSFPNGEAILLPTEDPHGHSIRTTLESVRLRWADLLDAELVQVAGRRAIASNINSTPLPAGVSWPGRYPDS
jgi:hypothetical protein